MRKKGIQLSIVFCSLMVLLGVSVLPNAWADPVIYSQPLDVVATGLLPSQNDTSIPGSPNFATVYDDFTLTSSLTVTDVHWVGGYILDPPNITAFTVTFWSDNAGPSGSVLLAQSISGNAGETDDSLVTNRFDYSVDLPISFSASAGTKYWLSIVADLPFPDVWAWAYGSGGDTKSYQDYTGQPRYENLTDLAFELTGTGAAVPEPATMLLLGSGLIGLWGFRRKFKK